MQQIVVCGDVVLGWGGFRPTKRCPRQVLQITLRWVNLPIAAMGLYFLGSRFNTFNTPLTQPHRTFRPKILGSEKQKGGGGGGSQGFRQKILKPKTNQKDDHTPSPCFVVVVGGTCCGPVGLLWVQVTDLGGDRYETKDEPKR